MADSPEHQKSSSSSDSSSEKSTPPSSPDVPEALPQPRPVAHYSATAPRRGGRHSLNGNGNTNRLGAIDEESPRVAPDIPTRSARRPKKTVAFVPADARKFFSFSKYSRPDDDDVPPPDFYEKIVGPHGEKFADLRQNRPYDPHGRGGGWRRMVCLGLVVLLVLAIALGVGLGVGLTRHKGASSSEPAPSSPGSAENQTEAQDFPIGTYAIPTYLISTNTSCTSVSSTWSCYPYTTYSQSTVSSFSTLQWQISSPDNSTLNLQISNTNPTFSYPFTDAPLELDNAGDSQLSAFTFSFTYRKEVIPSTDITGDNAATRCYYNGTMVTARLYSSSQGGSGNVTGPPSGTTISGAWPYAIEIAEMINEGPQCYRYDNGQLGDEVDVTAASGECACDYRNYALS